VFQLLGLREEEEKAEKARKAAGVDGKAGDKANCPVGIDTASKSLPVDDCIPWRR
jgi:hypothetical protein